MSDLKEKIKEIVEIVALVPEQFKTTCFELLLKEAIANTRIEVPASVTTAVSQHHPNKATQQDIEVTPEASMLSPAQPKVEDGTDISISDIHMKVRKFMEKGDITVSNLNELFYKENGSFESLVTDLGVTKMSEAQIRITPLQTLHNALASGDFFTTVENVREECKMRKSYDGTNFTANFKNNTSLFDFGAWTKDVTELKLSEEGKKSLANVIKALS